MKWLVTTLLVAVAAGAAHAQEYPLQEVGTNGLIFFDPSDAKLFRYTVRFTEEALHPNVVILSGHGNEGGNLGYRVYYGKNAYHEHTLGPHRLRDIMKRFNVAFRMERVAGRADIGLQLSCNSGLPGAGNMPSQAELAAREIASSLRNRNGARAPGVENYQVGTTGTVRFNLDRKTGFWFAQEAPVLADHPRGLIVVRGIPTKDGLGDTRAVFVPDGGPLFESLLTTEGKGKVTFRNAPIHDDSPGMGIGRGAAGKPFGVEVTTGAFKVVTFNYAQQLLTEGIRRADYVDAVMRDVHRELDRRGPQPSDPVGDNLARWAARERQWQREDPSYDPSWNAPCDAPRPRPSIGPAPTPPWYRRFWNWVTGG
jgi:hypothetical protein